MELSVTYILLLHLWTWNNHARTFFGVTSVLFFNICEALQCNLYLFFRFVILCTLHSMRACMFDDVIYMLLIKVWCFIYIYNKCKANHILLFSQSPSQLLYNHKGQKRYYYSNNHSRKRPLETSVCWLIYDNKL